MANHVHTGAAGFNHRPNPHSSPFWDMNGKPRSASTEEETNVLSEWLLKWGSSGPSGKWLESQSTIGRMAVRSGLVQRQFKFLEEQSKKPGVMGRLQPRINKATISFLASNPKLAAKYFPDHFPQFAENMEEPARGDLSLAEAKEKNTYYPNQPGIIMMASILNPFTLRQHLREVIYANAKQAPLKVSANFPAREGVNSHGPMLNIVSFFKICGTEIKDQILSNLAYTTKAMLFQSCLEIAIVVSEFSTLLDLGISDFHAGEYTSAEFKNLQIAGEIPMDAEQRGSKYVLLSQTHQRWVEKCRPYRTYRQQAEGLGRSLRYFQLNGIFIRQLTISGIPLVDLYALEAICGLCPNLQKCTVLKTEQIRLHDLPRFFLEYVAKQAKFVEFDIAPLYETGPRWANTDPTGGPDSDARKGTFGITHSDSGVKTNVAIVQFCVYSLFPALKAAGQEHMFYNGESLLRQWLEAQALPFKSLFRTIIVLEAKQKCKDKITESEKQWVSRNFTPGQVIPPYTASHWSPAMRKAVARTTVETSFMMAKAMFGDDMWVETFDRSTHANNYRCLVDNYARWGTKLRCLNCQQMLEEICYAGCFYCEDCRLKEWIVRESDHLKKQKLAACSELGFRRLMNEEVQSFATLGDSNFPKPEAFLESNANGELVSIINTKYDFLDKVLDAPKSSMRGFFDAVYKLDQKEKQLGPVGRCSDKQKDHTYGGYEELHTDPWLSVQYKLYRQAPTKEEYLMCGPGGWTPKQGKKVFRW